jgi:hypothetical protein
VLKLRPPGYFSWTIWPDSKSTPGRRPPRGILLFLSQLSFLIFAKCREYHVVRKQCFFFSSRNQHLWIFWIPICFFRSPGLPGFPEIFFLVCQSRPPKAPSCDLPTRDRISSKGPGEIWPMVSATYPVSDKYLHGSKPNISETFHWPSEDSPALSNHQDFTLGLFHLAQPLS